MTISVLVGYLYYFVYSFVAKRYHPTELANYHYYTALVIALSFFDLMALWSLAMTYFGGPGYVSDYFKAIEIDDNQFDTKADKEDRTYALHLVNKREDKEEVEGQEDEE